MPNIGRTPAAEEDLWDILLFIARDNEEAAFRFVDLIDDKLQVIARFPGAGEARPELLSNLRSFPVRDYLIFYRPTGDGIEVLRVVHGARDLRRLFKRE